MQHPKRGAHCPCDRDVPFGLDHGAEEILLICYISCAPVHTRKEGHTVHAPALYSATDGVYAIFAGAKNGPTILAITSLSRIHATAMYLHPVGKKSPPLFQGAAQKGGVIKPIYKISLPRQAGLLRNQHLVAWLYDDSLSNLRCCLQSPVKLALRTKLQRKRSPTRMLRIQPLVLRTLIG